MARRNSEKFVLNGFKYFLNVTCFCAAFGMTVLWLLRFSLDEDSVQIDLKPFNFPEGQYPMLSFCLVDPFIESRLKEYNDTLTGEMYREFLKGDRFYKDIENIDFDNVTLNLADFYLGDDVYFRNGSYKAGSAPNFLHEIPQVTFTGFYEPLFLKCYGLKSSVVNHYAVSFKFNSSIFPNGIRPHLGYSIVLIVHLPNQLVVSGNYGKYTWNKRTEKQEHYMDFSLTQLEILKRRKKSQDPCLSDDLDFDEAIVNDHLENVGCKAPYQKTNRIWETCRSKEKMKEASSNLMGKTKPKKACKSAASIIFAYHEQDFDVMGSDWFHVTLWFPDQYKEIVMVKAVDIETVIANAGGYIGLFLGKETQLHQIEGSYLPVCAKF